MGRGSAATLGVTVAAILLAMAVGRPADARLERLQHASVSVSKNGSGTGRVVSRGIFRAVNRDGPVARIIIGAILLVLFAMKLGLRRIAELRVDQREVVMRIAQIGCLDERRAIRVGRFGELPRILEYQRKVEEQRRVAAAPHQAFPIDRLGIAELPALVQQPAEIRVGAEVRGIRRDRLAIQANPRDEAQLAATLGWLDRADEARKLLVQMEQVARETRTSQNALRLALAYAALGDDARATQHLRPLVERSLSTTRHVLRLDPMWDRVRDQPEFKALLASPSK